MCCSGGGWLLNQVKVWDITPIGLILCALLALDSASNWRRSQKESKRAGRTLYISKSISDWSSSQRSWCLLKIINWLQKNDFYCVRNFLQTMPVKTHSRAFTSSTTLQRRRPAMISFFFRSHHTPSASVRYHCPHTDNTCPNDMWTNDWCKFGTAKKRGWFKKLRFWCVTNNHCT